MVNDELNMVVPEDWNIKHLDDFGYIVSGGTPSTSVILQELRASLFQRLKNV